MWEARPSTPSKATSKKPESPVRNSKGAIFQRDYQPITTNSILQPPYQLGHGFGKFGQCLLVVGDGYPVILPFYRMI